MGSGRVADRVLVGISEGTAHLPKRRLDNIIKVDIQKVGWQLAMD
jgi:hypothetical protein